MSLLLVLLSISKKAGENAIYLMKFWWPLFLLSMIAGRNRRGLCTEVSQVFIVVEGLLIQNLAQSVP